MRIPHHDKLKTLLLLGAFFLIAGCAHQDPAARRQQSAKLAADAGWTRVVLETTPFTLVAFTPRKLAESDTLTVYIEGDGFAWLNPSTPSPDPTPKNPLALKLALRDPGAHAVYLARPCQFAEDGERRNCSARYWTSDRFSSEVIAASSTAIDQLKLRSNARQLRLIGYSGGGAVAALVAARRTDVVMLVTVAGNLDHAAWTAAHHITPLQGSLNAADASAHLGHIPQQHYVGQQDKIIGEAIARSYSARFPAPGPSVTVMPGFDHHCCWEAVWPSLVAQDFGLSQHEHASNDTK